MAGFTYYTPTKVVFGVDSLQNVGKLIKEYGGTRVLIHYGGQSAVKSGLIDRIKKILDDEGLPHTELGGVVPNPHISKVREGIALGQKEHIDFILAAGGGSVIDSSKAIAYGMAEPDEDVWDLYAHTRRAKASLPVGAVVTIAAAGSEMSDSSVITDEENGSKRGYNDDLCRPKFAVMDPSLTLSLPDYQTMSGCTDIMMHTMERYFTNGDKLEITDALAEGLLRTVMKQAEILHQDPQNLDARTEVMWAGSLAHNGLTGCGNTQNDFASHRLEHEIGGMFDVTHGAGLAAIWPSWARYVMKDCMPRFVRFAVNVMGVEPKETDEETAIAGIEAMEDFYHSIGMPANFDELGIHPSDEQLEEMADRCEKAVDGWMGSARKLYRDDMLEIYRMACVSSSN